MSYRQRKYIFFVLSIKRKAKTKKRETNEILETANAITRRVSEQFLNGTSAH